MTDQPDGIGSRCLVEEALAELAKSDQWQRLPVSVGVAVYTRLWMEGSADTLTIRGDTEADTVRTNAYGLDVYRNTGTALDMIKEIIGLAAPGTPGAPVHVIGIPKPPEDDPIWRHVEVADDETP